MALLGIDIGTSGCKVTVFSDAGAVLAFSSQEYEPTPCAAGFLEINAERVWLALTTCIRKSAAASADRSLEPIRALAVSSFGEAAVPVDRNGRTLANGILFTDPRGQEQLDALVARVGQDNLTSRTGLPLHRMYTLLRLMWLRDTHPEIYEATDKYLQFEDFVLYRLTGETVTDYSLAARTMAFNILDKKWDQDILAAADIPASIFARAVPGGTPIGPVRPAVAAELGLPAGVMVVTGGHDQPCTALGSGVMHTGQAIDGIGTSECITTSFDEPVLDPALFAMNFHCGPHVVPGKYITFAYTMSAGGLLQWFRDTIGRPERDEAARSNISAYAFLDEQIGRDPSGLLVLPHLDGSGTPYLDPESRGAILGLSRQTSPLDIYRAMLEGITFEMRYNLECLVKTGIHVHALRAAGGGSKSAVWLQIKADILNRPVATLEFNEAGTLGAVMLAGVAAGLYRDLDEACRQLVREKHHFEPVPIQTERYEESYQRYKSMYTAIKNIWQQGGKKCR